MPIFTAELIGTAILVLLGDGVVANVLLSKSKGQNSGWIVITFGWGLAVAMAVYAVGRFSGAHINPAVTFGFASIGSVGWADVPLYLLGQFAGAILGAALVWLAYLPHWAETQDPGLKLAVYSTGPAVRRYGQNLVTEIIGTFVLVFGVLGIVEAFGSLGEGEIAGALSGALPPLLIGLLVLSIGLSLGGPTGYAINPARDLGPRIAHFVLPIAGKGNSDWGYSWVPVVGPVVGGVAAALVFQAVYPGI
ncbi:MAG: MIP/aquaporin family protein [Acidimicrobiales bacterium]